MTADRMLTLTNLESAADRAQMAADAAHRAVVQAQAQAIRDGLEGLTGPTVLEWVHDWCVRHARWATSGRGWVLSLAGLLGGRPGEPAKDVAGDLARETLAAIPGVVWRMPDGVGVTAWVVPGESGCYRAGWADCELFTVEYGMAIMTPAQHGDPPRGRLPVPVGQWEVRRDGKILNCHGEWCTPPPSMSPVLAQVYRHTLPDAQRLAAVHGGGDLVKGA